MGAAGAVALAVLTLTGSPASGASCNNSWLSAGGGLWFDGGNWSLGHAPTESENACIEVDGDYTVTIVGSANAASLSIGSTTTSGTQALRIGVPDDAGSLNALGGVTNGARGQIHIDSNRGSSNVHTSNATLTNLGRITNEGSQGLEAAFFGNVTNAVGGVIDVSHSMAIYSVGGEADVLINRGRINVANDQALIVRRSSTFTNAPSGHIHGEGNGHVVSGAEIDTTFNQAGTTSGPAPVQVRGGTLNYTGDGASHIEATGQFNLTGALADDQSLRVTDGTATAESGFTVEPGGDLRLHSRSFSTGLHTANALLLNRGTITTTGEGAGGTETSLSGPLTNAPDGLVRAEYGLGLYSSGGEADTYRNEGRFEIADGDAVIVRRSSTFTNAASGHIEGEGTGHVVSGAEIDTTFNEAGTTGGDKPVRVVGGTLNYIGDGVSDIEASNQFNLNGTLRSGQSLTIANGAANSQQAGFVNDGGQLRIEAFGVSSSLSTGAFDFENNGTTRAVGDTGGSEVQLFGDIVNTDRLELDMNTRIFPTGGAGPTLGNQGTLVIAAGRYLEFQRGASFEQSAGRTTLGGAGSRLGIFDATGVVLTGGILEGNGTIGANVTNGGEVRPGTSPGTLNIDGDYTQTANGVLVAEITASGNDLLDSTRTANLDGTLEVETEQGFGPAVGDTFKVVEASSRSGEFADVNGIGAGPYEVLYDPDGVRLRTIDPSDLPSLSIEDVSVREGDSGTVDAVFPVRLSEAQNVPVTVDFRTANGTARQPDDYTATTGSLRFAPGELEAEAVVPVRGDTTPEPDEGFQVNLSNAEGVQIADGRGIGTIENDELNAEFVTPDRGGDACCVTVTVHGAGFVPGASLTLSGPGADIAATDVRVAADGRSLGGLVDLTGVARASWDVNVANPPGRGAETLPGAFRVEAVRAPKLWTRIDGGGVARPSLAYTAMLAYGNTGNVDATGAELRLDGIPSFDRTEFPLDYPAGLVQERADEGRAAKLFIPRVPPGTSYAPVQPSFTDSGEVTLRARIIGDQFDPDVVPKLNPANEVTMEVTQATDPETVSPATLEGVYRVTGPGGGDISFEYELANAAEHREPTIARTTPAPGVVGYRFRGTVELEGQIKAYDNVVTGPETVFEALAGASNIASADERAGRQSARRAAASLARVGKRRDGPSPLDIVDAHASGIQAVSRQKLIDCLKNPPRGLPPVITNPVIEQQLRDYAQGGADAGTLSLVPVPGGVLGELAWEATTEAMGWTLGGSFESVLGRELGNAALNDPRFPRWDEMINFSDRIASALIWCAPPPPPANPPPSGGDSFVTKTIRVTNSRDPNEKAGPDGFGAERFIEGDEPLPYVIRFENVASATAPAQEVVITDQLDPSALDLSTLSLGPVQFGDVFAGPPPGLKHWTTDIDVRPEKDLIVRVEGDLNTSTGLLEWRFTSLDPDTLEPTTDPEAGFLPPNDNPPEGEGAVYFSVNGDAGLGSGDEIENSASIVFDTNAPIITNTWLNTIDRNPPTSRVDAATQTGGAGSCRDGLEVAWSGSDQGSGIAEFDVYASIDGSDYALWRDGETDTSGTYPATTGHTYRFFTVAQDRAGHLESAPTGADKSGAVTCDTTEPPPPPPEDPPASGDSDPPETTLTKAPAKRSEKKRAKFEFEADEPVSGFECKLDRKKWKSCDSPRKYKVGEGKHKFRVRAIDAAGNTDPTPAKAKFKRVG